MDTGFAQVISSTLTGIASIVVAVIAGYFTVRAAQIKASEKDPPQGQSATPQKSKANIILYAIIVSILSVPLGFVFAYTGNSLTGVPSDFLFGYSLDPAIISGIMSFAGYLLGAWVRKLEIGTGSIVLLFIITSVFSAPVSYSIAYFGNWLSGTPDYLLFSDSFDSLVVGGIMCSVGFIIGILTSSVSQKAAA